MTKVSDLEPIPGYGYSLPAKPAAMPSEEEIARLLFERGRDVHDARTWEEANVEMREWLKGHAAAVLALFAPILAEKERLGACLAKANANHEDFERRYYLESDRAEALEARALAAEAALAAAVAALEPFADEKNGAMQDLLWGDQPDTAPGTITTRLGHIRKAREVVRAAAIRAQGE